MQIQANWNCYIWIWLLNCRHILLVSIVSWWAASSLMGSIHKPHVSLETWVVHLSGLGWSLVWKPARNLTRSSLKYQGVRRNSSNLLTRVYRETVLCSLTFTQDAHPYCLNSRHMDTCLTLLKASRPLRAEDTTTCCFHRVTITMAGGPSEKSASYSEWIDLTESEGSGVRAMKESVIQIPQVLLVISFRPITLPPKCPSIFKFWGGRCYRLSLMPPAGGAVLLQQSSQWVSSGAKVNLYLRDNGPNLVRCE